MNLYTVQITFSDFTTGIGQYEANTTEEAVELFFQKAECLEEYDRKKILEIIKNRIKDKSALIHVADGIRGVWMINVGTDVQENHNDLPDIYGGRVIQTDPHAPKRS